MNSTKLSHAIGSPISVVVSMGAADGLGVTRNVVEGLIESGLDIRAKVLIGSSRDIKLEQLVEDCPTIELVSEVPNVGQILADAHVAIGAAGTSVWERSCLGVASLIYIIADNQEKNGSELRDHGMAAVYRWSEDCSPEILSQQFLDFVGDAERLKKFAANSSKICDGFGVQRVCGYLDPIGGGNRKIITLRRIHESDEQRILEWQCEPFIRAYSRNPAKPTANEHHIWFGERLIDTKVITEIILYNSTPAGMVRLDPLPDGEFEVSILVCSKFHRKGVGKAALILIRRYIPEAIIWADIDSANEASLSLFKSAGFIEREGGFVSKPSN